MEHFSSSHRRPKKTLKLFPCEPEGIGARNSQARIPQVLEAAPNPNPNPRGNPFEFRMNPKPNPRRIDYPPEAVTLTLTLALPGLENRKRKRNRAGKVMEGPNPTPPIPDALRWRIERELRGTGLRLLLQKRLFPSDTNEGENRLSMPKGQLAAGEFLTAREENQCRKKDEREKIAGMRVVLVEPTMHVTMVSLKKWDYNRSSSYVLCGNWNSVVENSNLRAGEIIQVWFFRDADGNPAFGLVNLGSPQ